MEECRVKKWWAVIWFGGWG